VRNIFIIHSWGSLKPYLLIFAQDLMGAPRKPENQKTRKPENQKTRKPENQKTRKPENQKTGKLENWK
jgi:hypothetical protein